MERRHTSISKSSSIFTIFPKKWMYCIKFANSQQFLRRWSSPGSSICRPWSWFCCWFWCSSDAPESSSERVRFRDTMAAVSDCVHVYARQRERRGKWLITPIRSGLGSTFQSLSIFSFFFSHALVPWELTLEYGEYRQKRYLQSIRTNTDSYRTWGKEGRTGQDRTRRFRVGSEDSR